MSLAQHALIRQFQAVKQAIAYIDAPHNQAQNDFIGGSQSQMTWARKNQCPNHSDRRRIEAKNIPPQPPRCRVGVRSTCSNVVHKDAAMERAI
jgi:hypothetical protein